MKRIFACDFETTVYEGQINTEVWSSALTELYDETETVYIHHSIDETFRWIKKQHCNMLLYYHNLKFDGEFILSYLMNKTKLKSVVTESGRARRLQNNEYTYAISSRGQFYSITIMLGGKKIEIRDSLKILPYSLKRLGESFKTKHKKLEMNYEGFRYAGCPITPEEEHYIKNDVLVLKEALEVFLNAGHTGLTIGSCCMKEYKKSPEYDERYFPNLYEKELDKSFFRAGREAYNGR